MNKRSALVFWIMVVMLILSGVMLFRDFYRSGRERRVNHLLVEEVERVRETQKLGSDDETGVGQDGDKEILSGESVVLPEYEKLWEQNKDLAGWLTIEDLGIDYGVMYTPDDPEYYLHRGFDREEAASGSLFIGEGWNPEGKSTIIYGHHMNDGSMFGKLVKYVSEKYAREHPYIRFDTLTERGEYQVVTAFYSKAYELKEKNVFRYYWYTDLRKEKKFNEFVAGIKQAALYDMGVEMKLGDEFLMLSTCSYHIKEGRFVVVAKKIG